MNGKKAKALRKVARLISKEIKKDAEASDNKNSAQYDIKNRIKKYKTGLYRTEKTEDGNTKEKEIVLEVPVMDVKLHPESERFIYQQLKKKE